MSKLTFQNKSNLIRYYCCKFNFNLTWNIAWFWSYIVPTLCRTFKSDCAHFTWWMLSCETISNMKTFSPWTCKTAVTPFSAWSSSCTESFGTIAKPQSHTKRLEPTIIRWKTCYILIVIVRPTCQKLLFVPSWAEMAPLQRWYMRLFICRLVYTALFVRALSARYS